MLATTMGRRVGAIVVVGLLLAAWPRSLQAATSGSLWFRPWSTPGQVFAVQDPAGTPFTLTFTSSVLGGLLHVQVFNPHDDLIQIEDLAFAGAGNRSITVAAATAGTYRFQLDDAEQGAGRYKFKTDLPFLVLPGGADFDAYDLSDGAVQGTYYFLVPANTHSFDLRLWVPDAGEYASFQVRDASNTLVFTTSLSGEDRTSTIAVDTAQAGRFWSIAIGHLGDVRFQVLGIPNWFADSPASWFDPEASNAAPLYAPKVDYPVGSTPASVAMGDLNGDGKMDVATANADSDTVSVLLNSGSPGSFATRVDYPTGSTPASVAVGDLNGDGRLDLAVANRSSDTISVLLNSGSVGGFATRVDYPTGLSPRAVAVGDLNNDGRLDLATANQNSHTVSVLLASGAAGSFATRVDYPTGGYPSSVAVGDLNNDGRLDLTSANFWGNTVSVLLASGAAGSFATRVDYPTGSGPHSVAVGDLNNDGRLDLAVANAISDTVSVLLASGTAGSFATRVDYPTGIHPHSTAAGDLNGDGRLDLAVANRGSDTVSALLASDNVGSFATPLDYPSGHGPLFIAVGDLDGDGRLDLTVANYDNASVSVLLNQGAAITSKFRLYLPFVVQAGRPSPQP